MRLVDAERVEQADRVAGDRLRRIVADVASFGLSLSPAPRWSKAMQR